MIDMPSIGRQALSDALSPSSLGGPHQAIYRIQLVQLSLEEDNRG